MNLALSQPPLFETAAEETGLARLPEERGVSLSVDEFSRRFRLSARQDCVLRMLVGGTAPKQIAASLRLSPSTVRRHAEELYRKCGARSQRELLALLARTLIAERA